MRVFNVDDRVLVYFPVKKTGQTHKFTSFWRGPFEVIEILTEVLLKINCGRNGAVATIHIDRVRKVRNQILRGESEGREVFEHAEAHAETADLTHEQSEFSESDNEPVVETRHKRVVRKPRWLRDYLSVFSISSKMPLTKITPRKYSLCPSCKKDFRWEVYLAHTRQCRKPKLQKNLACSVCKSLFTKKANLNKHVRKFHPVSATETSSAETSSEELTSLEKPKDAKTGCDEWDSDPAIQLDYEEESGDSSSESEASDIDKTIKFTTEKADELEIGRTIRKPTEPEKVRAPKRLKDSKAKEVEVKKPKLDSKVKETVSHVCEPMVQKQDIGVQVSGHRCEP